MEADAVPFNLMTLFLLRERARVSQKARRREAGWTNGRTDGRKGAQRGVRG